MHEMPHVLDGPAEGEVDGVVAAVVVEALLPLHVAHRRAGHGHVVEPGRGLDGHTRLPLLGGQEVGHLHQVAERHQAGELARVVDHGDVPEAKTTEHVGRLVPRRRERESDRVGRHPIGHRRLGRRRLGRGPQKVAFGQDPDAAVALHHQHRTDGAFGHPRRRHLQRLARARRDHRRRHQLRQLHDRDPNGCCRTGGMGG